MHHTMYRRDASRLVRRSRFKTQTVSVQILRFQQIKKGIYREINTFFKLTQNLTMKKLTFTTLSEVSETSY